MIHYPVRDILADTQSERALIQDSCPFPDSIEWQIGQSYFRENGNSAFIKDSVPVPYIVNNDGLLSANAADVFFASLLAAEQAGELEDDIFILEIGIGIGLFARFFLDTFQALCEQNDKDYYDRLMYVAGDYSQAMLQDAGRHGIFASHPSRYVLRVVDAFAPEEAVKLDPLFARLGSRPFRAVFLNYMLDCLPATVLQIDGPEVRHLCVRTYLARGANLKGHSDLTIEDLKRMAASQNPSENQQLRHIYPVLVL